MKRHGGPLADSETRATKLEVVCDILDAVYQFQCESTCKTFNRSQSQIDLTPHFSCSKENDCLLASSACIYDCVNGTHQFLKFRQ